MFNMFTEPKHKKKNVLVFYNHGKIIKEEGQEGPDEGPRVTLWDLRGIDSR